MRKIIATTVLAISLLGASAVPASAGNAFGKDCNFGQTHAAKALNGEMGKGNGGHAPGEHRGATKCGSGAHGG